MADRVMPGPVDSTASVREAVCIHTQKIYDSCRDKDCIEDLRLYPDTASQAYIANAIGVRAKSAELLYAAIDVEEVAFNRGYFTVDVRYFYKIKGEAYSLTCGAEKICGLCIFDKRVLLFGSEGNARIFTSRPANNSLARTNLPMAVVEVVDPIVLGIKLSEVCDNSQTEFELAEIPSFIGSAFPNGLLLTNETKRVYVTLGQFSIIRLERDSQLLMPVYDYCLPEKECVGGSEDDPCELFKRIRFPVDEFFPPDTLESCNDYKSIVSSDT
ncbi:MAG: hypothetical protein GX942_02135 [Papillibacter sp.]|jgi:hypothetical protein|nr:hypothetical protein [Papillibacter sp.]